VDQSIIALVRDLGSAGILGLSLIFIVRTIAPLITALTDAQKQQADARREQTEASKAVLKRWEESDHVLDQIGQSTVDAFKSVKDELASLTAVDTQRIKQNDVTAAQITGAREDIRALSKDFAAGKSDAVNEVSKAMDDKLKPIEVTLQSIQKQVMEALELLHKVTAERAAQPDPPTPPESKDAPNARPE
jgi:hypothetical protein